MNARQTWVLVTAAVLAALTLGAFLGPRSAAQRAEQPKAEVVAGRYQALHLTGEADSVLVLDTATGHCWALNTGAAFGNNWTDKGSPTQPQK
jgi:hypothetical protein